MSLNTSLIFGTIAYGMYITTQASVQRYGVKGIYQIYLKSVLWLVMRIPIQRVFIYSTIIAYGV